MASYEKIKELLEDFNREKFGGKAKITEDLERIKEAKLFKDAKVDNLMASAIAFKYLKDNNLYGKEKHQFTLKSCADFFGTTSHSTSSKTRNLEIKLMTPQERKNYQNAGLVERLGFHFDMTPQEREESLKKFNEGKLKAPKAEIENKILELKITLADTNPKIYRTVLVPNNFNFDDLHIVIQVLFGWNNSHLYSFMNGRETIGLDDENSTVFADELKLKERLYETKFKIQYIYDFGDDWNHIVEVKKILDIDENVFYPKCIDAKMANAFDDVGGVWGYYEFLEIINDKKHEEHKNYVEWSGFDKGYDPNRVSIEKINRDLKKTFK